MTIWPTDGVPPSTHAGKAAQATWAGGTMDADRTVLADAMWARTGNIPAGRATDPGVTAADSRLFGGAVPVRFRTGSPWRDLPERFGKWNGVSRRFRRWTLSGDSGRVSDVLSDGSGLDHVFIDGAVVQAHRKAAGAKGGTGRQGTGRSRGGLTGRAVAVVDAPGCPVRFTVLPGQKKRWQLYVLGAMFSS